jgi:hypothetical protein
MVFCKCLLAESVHRVRYAKLYVPFYGAVSDSKVVLFPQPLATQVGAHFLPSTVNVQCVSHQCVLLLLDTCLRAAIASNLIHISLTSLSLLAPGIYKFRRRNS